MDGSDIGKLSSWNFAKVKVWSWADSKSVTCSNVSWAFTLITGLVDFCDVDLEGIGRFKPQSPRFNDVPGVTIAARVG